MIKNKRSFFFIILCCGYFQFIASSAGIPKSAAMDSSEDLTLSSNFASMSSLSLDEIYRQGISGQTSRMSPYLITPQDGLTIDDQNALDGSESNRSRNSVILERIQSRLGSYTPRGRSSSSARASTSQDVSSGQYTPVDFLTPAKGTAIHSIPSSSASMSELSSGRQSVVRFSPVMTNTSELTSVASALDFSHPFNFTAKNPANKLSASAASLSPGAGSAASYQNITPVTRKTVPVAQKTISPFQTPAAQGSVTPVSQKGRLTPINKNNRDVLLQDIDAMTDSPGRSKQLAAKAVIDTIAGGSFDQASRSVDQQELLNAFDNNPGLASFFSRLAQYMSPDEVKEYAVAITNHAIYPQVEQNPNGSIFKVNGGHNLQEMFKPALIKPGDTIFVGQDDVTVGVLIGISQKTMRSDFNVNFIMDFMQNSTWIAQNRSSDTFKISQMPGDNTFIGSYQKPGNPFIYQSFFPVMVVNGNLIDENNYVYVGRFTKLDAKGQVPPNIGKDKELRIPQSDLRKMVNSSNKKFETIDPFVLVSDITQSMFKRFKYNFPVPIYGLFDDRKA